MLIIHGLIIGSLSMYASLTTHKALKKKKYRALQHKMIACVDQANSGDSLPIKHETDTTLVTTKNRVSESKKNFAVASVSLGLIVSGSILFAPLSLLGAAGLVYLVWPTWKQGYKDLTQKRCFTRMVLESFILPVTLLTGNFLAAGFAYWFLYFALNNVAKAKGNATKNLANVFVTPSNRLVYVMRDDVEVELTLKELQVGDVIVLGAGEIIPIDGIITKGHCAIDQHLLTGESQLIEKKVDDNVFASTLLLTGPIYVRVEKAGTATIASQTSKLLNEMTAFTENLELRSIDMSDRMALPYFMLGAATTVFRGVSSGLAIFWAPIDDALYAAGPLSVLNYLNIALRRGILVKDGRVLETLRHVDTIVFDKTGTLTKEIPKVVSIHSAGEISEQSILRYAAAAEQKQVHPVAVAIVEAATEQGVELPTAKGSAYKTGYGLTVTIGEKTVQVGSYRFMQQLSLELPSTLETIHSHADEQGYSLIYVAVDEHIIGVLELHAALREETAEVITTLRDKGYKLCIISGDHEKPTRHLAQQLGIDHYHAETLPEEKAMLIKAMQQKGQVVCYLGDGINDTIALKQAEVSISLHGASTIATDTAQIVLMNEQLTQLLEVIALAKDLDRTFKNTITASAIPSVAIVGGVFIFHLGITAAIVAYLAGMGMSFTSAMLPLLKEKSNGTEKITDSFS